MPEPQKYIVGRESEIKLLEEFIESDTDEFILNVYGPGGIGKTEVCSKIMAHCQEQDWVCLFAQIDAPNQTYDRVLHNLMDSLLPATAESYRFREFFRGFEARFSEYLVTKEVLEDGGGSSAVFDGLGDPILEALTNAIAAIGEPVTDEIRQRFRSRYVLEDYFNSAELRLTESFVDGLLQVRNRIGGPTLIMIDTYEKASCIDEWMCNRLVRMLPDGIRLIISGRDRLREMGFHWIEYTRQISSYALPELDEESTFDFYRHFGLTDPDLLKATYEFTGGYPLCMTLAVELARESGWGELAGFEKQRDRYEVARYLLDRLLEQEGVAEVKEFLEKGVILPWFGVEDIAFLLNVPPEKAEDIYHSVSKYSFTSRTELGLKFHDRVRDILMHRLEYVDRKLYEELLVKARSHYQAMVEQEWLET